MGRQAELGLEEVMEHGESLLLYSGVELNICKWGCSRVARYNPDGCSRARSEWPQRWETGSWLARLELLQKKQEKWLRTE